MVKIRERKKDNNGEGVAMENQPVASHASSSDAEGDASATQGAHEAGTYNPLDEQNLTVDEASAFAMAVKGIFQEEKEKYDEFLETLNAFDSDRISGPEVRERMKRLFKEHPVLFWGMNNFLPDGYKYIVPAYRNPVDTVDARTFIQKLKDRVDAQDYRDFLEILKIYRESFNQPFDYFCIMASVVLKDHYDLLDEIGIFLPPVEP